VAAVSGNLTYMAPEQFYNFSLARAPADIFSIGRILCEVVEGRITEQVKPFKQVRLSNTETAYLKTLNEIVMAATAEKPSERLGSARELKDRLLQLGYCRLEGFPVPPTGKPRDRWRRRVWLLTIIAVLAAGVLAVQLTRQVDGPVATPVVEAPAVRPEVIESVAVGTAPPELKQTIRAQDNSDLHLIPPIELELKNKNVLGSNHIALNAFYLSESPVTNQQYVAFLNANLARIKIEESDVLLDGRLVIKLSEKIRGYKPIVFEGGRFISQDPMHSACAVLLVTGNGAQAYARYYGMRLMNAREWYTVLLTGGNLGNPRLPLPTPVINYEKNRYGIRGINQLAEWGETGGEDFVILGQSPSEMIEADLILEKDPFKYYTDTGLRVTRNAGP